MKFQSCEKCGSRLIPECAFCPGCGAAAGLEAVEEMRCECGFLLGKLLEDAIEIKCRRCKRLVYLPVEDLPERFEEDKRRMAERRARMPEPLPQPGEKGLYCSSCGRQKPNIVYGKCLECRTGSIKVQYKRTR